jgi:hypothetical protein
VKKKKKIVKYGRDFCSMRIKSAVKRVEGLDDRMSSLVPIGRLCHIALNMQAPNDESEESNDSFFGDLE